MDRLNVLYAETSLQENIMEFLHVKGVSHSSNEVYVVTLLTLAVLQETVL